MEDKLIGSDNDLCCNCQGSDANQILNTTRNQIPDIRGLKWSKNLEYNCEAVSD